MSHVAHIIIAVALSASKIYDMISFDMTSRCFVHYSFELAFADVTWHVQMYRCPWKVCLAAWLSDTSCFKGLLDPAGGHWPRSSWCGGLDSGLCKHYTVNCKMSLWLNVYGLGFLDIRATSFNGKQEVDNSRTWRLYSGGSRLSVFCNKKVKKKKKKPVVYLWH